MIHITCSTRNRGYRALRLPAENSPRSTNAGPHNPQPRHVPGSHLIGCRSPLPCSTHAAELDLFHIGVAWKPYRIYSNPILSGPSNCDILTHLIISQQYPPDPTPVSSPSLSRHPYPSSAFPNTAYRYSTSHARETTPRITPFNMLVGYGRRICNPTAAPIS